MKKTNTVITVEEVKALACKHYESGGDAVVECYEDRQIQRNIQGGMTTKESWLELFRFLDAVAEDIRNS